MQAISVAALAEYLNAEYKGDGTCIISGIAPLASAKPGDVAFLDNPKYKKYLSHTHASAVILAHPDLDRCPTNAIITTNPYFAYAKVAELFVKDSQPIPGIHETAIVGQGCSIPQSATIGANCILGQQVSIGKNVVIDPGCIIGDYCVIDDESHLYPKVILYAKVHLGRKTIVHSGVVIGADGFGFAKAGEGWYKIQQLGSVRIEDDVEIGANTTIDRGALGDTVIERGVKLDNQIQIGHNVKIGAHSIIAGCVGIAGSAIIGKRCMIGGGARINGHIQIADDTVISGATGVSKSIKEPGVYCSALQLDKRERWIRKAIQFNRLDEMADRLRKAEQSIAHLHQELAQSEKGE